MLGQEGQLFEIPPGTFDPNDFNQVLIVLWDNAGLPIAFNRTYLDEDIELGRFAEPAQSQEKLRFVYAVLQFLQQRILVSSRQRLSRAARRHGHDGERAEQDMVGVITLREKVYAHRELGAMVSPPQWASRWTVRGHWRSQWMPKSHMYAPRFIHPYIKGPDGLPIRHTERLFAVVR